jgi:radical SAM protein with 4Fe4S-binding SPASM domain
MCITQKLPIDRSKLPCMQDDLFRKITRECFPFIKIAHLSIDGEPLMASNLDKTIEAARRYGVKLDITTNATLWNGEKLINRLIPVLNGAYFSIDAATKRIFESIRAGADFDKVIANMQLFSKLRLNCKDSQRPRFIIVAVLMRRNIEELPLLVELARELGVEEIWTQHVKIYDEKFKQESLLFHKELANKCLKAARERARELNFRITLPPPYRTAKDSEKYSHPPSFRLRAELCPYLWREAMITISGDVLPCCNAHPSTPIMGNVARNSFLEIWNNKIYRRMRSGLLNERPFQCCMHCSFLLGQPFPDDEESYLQYDRKHADLNRT